MRHSRLHLFVVLIFVLQSFSAFAVKKSYVVYLGEHSHKPDVTVNDLHKVTNSHYQLLSTCLGREDAKDSIFYSYTRHINGFAAVLDEAEAEAISKHPEVISVFLNQGRKLHTTHSWNFLGLEKDGVIPSDSIWAKARFGEDTIIANLDTGVWPESPSFNDEGMGPVPSKWKGICQIDNKAGILCNRKLIGARYFNRGYETVAGSLNASLSSPRDSDGHGTHTLSTAGGSFVPAANVFGYGNGTAKGGSPKARVAAYKVCWPPVDGGECFDADVMAGFDAAIADGVDVISMSLGGDPSDYFKDGLSIGSFHAVKKGIVVVASAGNSGPAAATVSNISPWMLTVGASSIDREFNSYVSLGNKLHLKGESLSPTALPKHKSYPLIGAVAAKEANATVHDAELCQAGTLDPKKVKGKILVCLRGVNARVDKGQQAAHAGAVGMILANDESTGNEVIADAHVLPASHITYKDGVAVFAYMNSTKSPTAYITRVRMELGTKPAPVMAAFSSRGPNTITPEILKPDITAPGVSIIAAYTQATGPTGQSYDKRRVLFNTESGTSMSCPHVSGIVGLLKTLHPDWSPSAIKSAIMTSARTRDNKDEPMLDSTSNAETTPFSYGAGQVRPNRAMDPGLVYDLTTKDYLNFLCAMGYNETSIRKFSDRSYKCPKSYSLLDFNYPSITVPHLTHRTTVTRRVKNVGASGTYRAVVKSPAGISVKVDPVKLEFKERGEEKTFKVTLKSKTAKAATDHVFGSLLWTDDRHYVRSPIVVKSA
ncbi:hypothetical protein Syun_010648 [Stephania yunnanensis]|uniref:Subtilisin n=1 Tax=Stephania yunnanensis TaxID=152371 RepID=A0AAP0KIZ9_9MAGN